MKLTSFFLALASLPALANLSPNQLECEYLDNPLGIDNRQPQGGVWNPRQHFKRPRKIKLVYAREDNRADFKITFNCRIFHVP